MPIRIQRKRSKGWKMPKGAVYVGRPTKWGNPYTGQKGFEYPPRLAELYREWIVARDDDAGRVGHSHGEAPTSERIKRDLRGKDLACWCPLDQACHADVLLEIANATPSTTILGNGLNSLNDKRSSLSTAPPEPREPAAREGAFEGPAFEWLQQNGYKELGQPIHYEHDGHVGYRYPHEILTAYSAELRAEKGQVEAELQRVRDDREDVCNRLDTAESRIQYLETADIQRAKDITRLTVQRDEYLETAQRTQGDFERARSAYEASERSLLQARAILSDYAETWKAAHPKGKCSRPDQCLVCRSRTFLASTSAPEGGPQNNSSQPIDNG